MQKNKILFIGLSLLLTTTSSLAMEYEDLNSLQPPAYRLGITDEVEEQAPVNTVQNKSTRELNIIESIDAITFADLGIKRISKELSKDLMIDESIMQMHLSMLWQGAATKSDIIKFTLYKLANPDKDKPDEKSVKKVLGTIANMSTLLGAGSGNALLSASSFLSGNILGIFSQDDKEVNYRYTKVNDADMIVLVRKIEDLQQKIVNRYYDYMTTREVLKMAIKNTERSYENYIDSQELSKEIILITDAYYRKALDEQMKANLDYQAKRASLEELVGHETFIEFENSIKED